MIVSFARYRDSESFASIYLTNIFIVSSLNFKRSVKTGSIENSGYGLVAIKDYWNRICARLVRFSQIKLPEELSIETLKSVWFTHTKTEKHVDVFH